MFKSTLRMCSNGEFFKEIAPVFGKNGVEFPWTAKETLKACSAYTRGVYDCTAATVAIPGDSVVLAHIAPNSNNIKTFELAKKSILDRMDKLGEGVQGLLLGGTKSDNSRLVFDMFEEFMTKEKIPYSKLHIHKIPDNNGSSVAYNAVKDTFSLTNKNISDTVLTSREKFAGMSKSEMRTELEKILKNNYEDVEVSGLNLIV